MNLNWLLSRPRARAGWCLILTLLAACVAGPADRPAGVEPGTLRALPPLSEAVARALSHGGGAGSASLGEAEIVYEVKTAYDRIRARKEQIGISKEVQGHFEKAVTNAEQKFEEGEGDITQGSLTKLKLGRAGTLNDISQFESDIALARLDLERLMGVRIDAAFEMDDTGLTAREFPFRTLEDYRDQHGKGGKGSANPGASMENGRRVALEKALVRVNQARSQFDLARQNRKMTRALLVTEVANYDFGIGSEKDLFETLIIYTRVLVGFYDALYNFNEAVAAFEREVARGKPGSDGLARSVIKE